MAGKVVVIGGGIAGLSAAHHLLDKGFEVEVYEHHDIPGGKARSLGCADTGVDGRHDLPAEHGFRFFPAYYRHIIDTMANTPYWDTDQNIVDQLIMVEKASFNSFRHRPNIVPSKMPHDAGGFYKLWKFVRDQPKIKFKFGERLFYAMRIWQIMTSCQERRDDEYEQTPWWHFIDAQNKSLNYQRYLANMTRTLVAADPRKVSTRTNGNVWVQTLLGFWDEFPDRILRGPTNEMWIHPWLKYLIGRGLKYHINATATEFHVEDGLISGVTVERSRNVRPGKKVDRIAHVLDCNRYGITDYDFIDDETIRVSGDYYISAVPVERMAKLLCSNTDPADTTPLVTEWTALADSDPALKKIEQLRHSVAWMNGLQFYLKPSPGQPHVPDMPGHSINVDSPFALTTIFQCVHYWPEIDMADYGDGTVQNILSVDISDWVDGRGRLYNKPAFELTREQVMEEVWTDVKTSLRHWPQAKLDDENLVHWCLDYDIVYALDAGVAGMGKIEGLVRNREAILQNKEPLLVNRVNTWQLRPQVQTGIDNLLLASDYVQTLTDLATMEGANEAARHAVNTLLDKTSSDQPRCEVWALEEPAAFKPFREYDRKRYFKQKSWSNWWPIWMPIRLIGQGLAKLAGF